MPARLRLAAPAPSLSPLEGAASTASPRPHLAERLCPGPGPPTPRSAVAPHKCEQAGAGGGSRVPIRRPVCGSHHRCHLQGCSPREGLCPHLCRRQSPSASAGTRGVRRCRPPCSAPPSPAPGNTDGDGAGGFKRRLRSHSAPFTTHNHPPPPRPYPPLRPPSPSELHPWGGSTSASPQGYSCSAGGWEGWTHSHPVSRFRNHSSSPPSINSQHPGEKELTSTD